METAIIEDRTINAKNCWHQLSVEQALEILESTKNGLSIAEANRRLGIDKLTAEIDEKPH